jgi:drug/metabolite transporter (DMT)-like permease
MQPTVATPPVRATRIGVLAISLSVVGWAITNILVKITKVEGLAFVFYRLWAGAVIMLLVCAVLRRPLTWPKIKAAAPGGALFGFNVALFVSAIKLTGVADVLIIQAVQPALTLMVAGPLFGERITRSDVGWTLASIGGVVLVVLGSSGTPSFSLRGDVLAVFSLLVWTVYFLVSKRARRDVPAIEYMTVVTVMSAVLVTPVVLVSGQSLGGWRWQDVVMLAAFLVAAQGGHVLVAWAHAQVDVSISTLVILAQPIIAVAAAAVILNEEVTLLEVLGGVVVMVAVSVIVRRATRGSPDVALSSPDATPS